MHVADYILPTGTKIDFANPEAAEYFDSDQIAYVMTRVDESRSKPSRVFTSFGEYDELWAVGSKHICKHDQTGRQLGIYEVTGVMVFKTGATLGVVPTKGKANHCVFK